LKQSEVRDYNGQDTVGETTRYSTRNVPKRGNEGTFVRITNLNVSNYYHEVGKIDLSSLKLLKNTPIVIINLKIDSPYPNEKDSLVNRK